MKLTFCGINPTSIKKFWKRVEVKRNEEIELDEEQAIQLLNWYWNTFCHSWDTERVKMLLKESDDREKARQNKIDQEIAEKLEREESEKKGVIKRLEKEKIEKEIAQKQAIKRQEKEIENIRVAEKNEKAKKEEMIAVMEKDKTVMDERIAKIKKTLFTNKK